MSRESRRRAFDPFFTTKGSLASGLGLSVAYGIVRRHGGRIDLESAPGQGTRVRIRLPALGLAASPAPLLPAAEPSPQAARARILLVEDDDDNREAMASLLGLGGHQVTAAASGGDGVRRLAADRFDLVVTDLGLPDMTGWEVARQVKEACGATPVALITGWGLNLAPEEIRRRGVDLLIKKPIEPRKFLLQVSGLARP
jgi:CheY-like chemotaxis protein